MITPSTIYPRPWDPLPPQTRGYRSMYDRYGIRPRMNWRVSLRCGFIPTSLVLDLTSPPVPHNLDNSTQELLPHIAWGKFTGLLLVV